MAFRAFLAFKTDMMRLTATFINPKINYYKVKKYVI